MNEKIVIESQRCKKALILYLVAISIVLSLLLLIPTWKTASQHDQKCYEIYTQHQSKDLCADKMCSYCKHVDKYSSSFAYLIDVSLDSTAFDPLLYALPELGDLPLVSQLLLGRYRQTRLRYDLVGY